MEVSHCQKLQNVFFRTVYKNLYFVSKDLEYTTPSPEYIKLTLDSAQTQEEAVTKLTIYTLTGVRVTQVSNVFTYTEKDIE